MNREVHVRFDGSGRGKIPPATLQHLACHVEDVNRTCVHGTKLVCWRRHQDDESIVGAPLCYECWDVEAQVVWNASLTPLWNRTMLYFERELAKELDLTMKELHSGVKREYLKVVEFQARGVAHLHVIIRFDDPHDRAQSPEMALTADRVERVLRAVVAKVWLERKFGEGEDEDVHRIVWGQQLDCKQIYADNARQVVNYLAKYATKAAGVFDHQFRAAVEINHPTVPEHLRVLAQTCFDMGEDGRYDSLRTQRWAHDLGCRGHFLTKSRLFSVTFARLREIRYEWVRENAASDSMFGGVDFEPGSTWMFVESGWFDKVDAYFAQVYSMQAEADRIRSWQDWRDDCDRVELGLTG
ncbi:MAG: replication initiator [Ferrimicrobium sp.]